MRLLSIYVGNENSQENSQENFHSEAVSVSHGLMVTCKLSVNYWLDLERV